MDIGRHCVGLVRGFHFHDLEVGLQGVEDGKAGSGNG